nr:PREDICTED: uncharacterized protein LOC104945316 [Notothenia coriiceps]
MIWYVATLIASVFSTRGTAAQGAHGVREEPRFVTARAGESVILGCDVSPPLDGQQPPYVVEWFKFGVPIPFFINFRFYPPHVDPEYTAEANPAIPGGSKTGEQQHITTFFHAPLANSSTRSKAIADAIAFFICKDIQPYSVTENEGFLHLLHILEPRYHVPNRRFFTEKQIPALYDKVRRELVDSLSNAQRVAITVDGWTSCATDSYVTVTAHYIDDEWVLQNHVLQTRVFNEAHTGNNLAMLLQEVCREWKIEDKNPALVTGNARTGLDFDGRYTYLQDLLHYASALDPRIKDLAFLDDNETKDMIFMKITAEVVKMDGQCK